ncbi:MAG: hypothetical protein M1298_01870 [Chloroflexi bacterium]|nr:hypothetical protein [Chloroflexota bacterium]
MALVLFANSASSVKASAYCSISFSGAQRQFIRPASSRDRRRQRLATLRRCFLQRDILAGGPEAGVARAAIPASSSEAELLR